jgi:cytosine/adenosine deaminase-related metal-dependent hydrolase
VIRHATYNGARCLGREQEFGRLLPGLAADLIVVEGNPLRDLKRLYPAGALKRGTGDGRAQGGGIRWTVCAGRFHHGPTLMLEVAELVRKARSSAAGTGR